LDVNTLTREEILQALNTINKI